MKRRAFLFAVSAAGAFAGVGSRKALYVGGTWSLVPQGTEGVLDVEDEKAARFRFGKGGQVEIPYAAVTSLEYGQKAGRRVGATMGWGVVLGFYALPLLLSKKRKHYFSIGYTAPDGKPQGIVFELGKDVTRPALKVFEARSGKKVEFESKDAKANRGN